MWHLGFNFLANNEVTEVFILKLFFYFRYGGKKCEYLPPCYKSFCVQRYAYVKLLCVDPFNPHYRPIVDVFEIPTACSCFVENFVYY